MSFVKGFLKTAADPIIFSNIAKAGLKGLKAGGESSVKDAIKLKGLKHVSDAVHASGGLKKSVTTQAGRERLAEGIGKAAPSIGAGAAYGLAAKKVYNKASENNQPQGGYY